MAQCQVKTGIFVVRECGAISGITCADCGKNVCAKHTRQSGPKAVCIECLAKSNNVGNLSIRPHSNRFDSLWYFTRRLSFFQTYNYTPFEGQDYDGFEKTNQQEIEDDNEKGGFLDS